MSHDRVKVTVKCNDSFYTVISTGQAATDFRDTWDDVACPEKLRLQGVINDLEPNYIEVTFRTEEISAIQIMEIKV